MSSNNQKSKQSNDRSPNGRPPKGRKTISLSVALVALGVILLVQWTNGDIGKWLSGVAILPSPVVQVEIAQATPSAEATATVKPSATPKASAAKEDQATVTPPPAATAKPRGQNQPSPTKTPRPRATPSPTANSPPVARASDLPTVAYEELPPEAQEAIILIDQGGPFPYSRDGIVFQNRERILPSRPDGYYHEYTVITPGSRDRGARRVITGEDGEMYYTDDHYDSFSEIVR